MDAVEEVFRRESAHVVASLIRRGSTIDQAEDAVQEAFAVALQMWPRDGVPPKPGAWISTTARRRLIDRLRREARRSDKELLTALSREPDDLDATEDDRLRLIFTCCHPALSLDVRVALTLRATCGLSTGQLADAFVVPESTMAQRLVRAQRKIAVANIPFVVPSGEELGPRLSAVLAVVYLVFTTGYNAVTGASREQAALCDEAIRLARLLHVLMPNEAEVVGLLALMLLHDARRAARISGDEMVLFDDQDRSRWNADEIAEGLSLVKRAAHMGAVGQYWLQAAIAAEHAAPATSGDRNWNRIAALYERLVDHTDGSAIARLNHAIAVSMARGPREALELADALRDRLDSFGPFHGARADFLARLGRRAEAVAAYERAISLADNEIARRSLQQAVEKLG